MRSLFFQGISFYYLIPVLIPILIPFNLLILLYFLLFLFNRYQGIKNITPPIEKKFFACAFWVVCMKTRVKFFL